MNTRIKTSITTMLIVLCMSACGGGQKERSVIAVSGTGTVLAQPDTIQMHISLSSTAATTQQAQEEVGLMVRQALGILQNAGVEDKNISTASLRFYPEYEWGGSRRMLLGQKAEQHIAFSVSDIRTTGEKVPAIIDRLIQINGIELNQMSFSIKDSAELYTRSRELAWQKALEKAEQYARLSGMKIARPLSIAEEGYAPVSPVMSNRMVNTAAYAMEDQKAALGGTVLPAGEMEITARIMVEFLLK